MHAPAGSILQVHNPVTVRGGSRKKIFGGLAPHHLGGNNG